MTINSALFAATLGLTVATATLSAQATDSSAAPAPKSRWEAVVPSGTLVPTGAQRGAIKRGNLSALQVNYRVRPALAITSTVGWARSRDVAISQEPKLDVFTYDVGVETRAPAMAMGKSATFRPFAGAGAGGRSYNHRTLELDATHNLAAYASVGGELGVRRLRLRLEARDYVTGFKPLAGNGESRVGNDVVVMVGVGFVRR